MQGVKDQSPHCSKTLHTIPDGFCTAETIIPSFSSAIRESKAYSSRAKGFVKTVTLKTLQNINSLGCEHCRKWLFPPPLHASITQWNLNFEAPGISETKAALKIHRNVCLWHPLTDVAVETSRVWCKHQRFAQNKTATAFAHTEVNPCNRQVTSIELGRRIQSAQCDSSIFVNVRITLFRIDLRL